MIAYRHIDKKEEKKNIRRNVSISNRPTNLFQINSVY